MFAAELKQLHDAHPGYRMELRTTRTQGRLDLSRLDEVVPDSRTVVMDGQGHSAMDTGTDLFTAEVLSFLEATKGGG